MKQQYYLAIEMFLLFVLMPVSFLLPYPIQAKIGATFIGFGYVLYTLKNSGFRLQTHFFSQPFEDFWKNTFLKLAIISLITGMYVFWVAPDQLFHVVLNNPIKWFVILLVYSFFSVWPQEIIYRTFFFHRYGDMISNRWLFIFINALLFSLAHLFFRNFLVQLATFIGGLLFAFTFYKTKSTVAVSIEHAIYGNWLFTVGLGAMLGFPS